MASLPGYKGEILDVEALPNGATSLPAAPDFRDIAERSLHYLANNPDPERGYQSRFSFFLLLCPPFAPLQWFTPETMKKYVDPIAVGDTENRNDAAFNKMREIAGSDTGLEVQEIVHRRLVGYVRGGPGRFGEGVCWCDPLVFSEQPDGDYISQWATSKLLESETDLLRLTGDEEHAELSGRLARGLKRLAQWDTGRAFFPNGAGVLREDKVPPNWGDHYPHVIAPLTHFHEVTGDQEALDFAVAMAEGFLADLQPRHLHCPRGHVHGHNHILMHAVRGVARLGALMGEWRFLDWAEAAYRFYAEGALDTGWLPEVIGLADHQNHCETCLVGDMTECEIWLARAGKPHYWDRVERTIRNYLMPLQFSLTPELEDLYRRIHHGLPTEEVEGGLGIMRSIEGSFVSAPTPNDRIFAVRPDGKHEGSVEWEGERIVLDTMGCCAPRAMSVLHLAWASIVTEEAGRVLVNLPFDRDCAAAKVESEVPRAGQLTVTAKRTADYLLRPPGWAPRGEVKARRGGVPVDVEWAGPAKAYVRFASVRPGETLHLSWPLVHFRQRASEVRLEGTPTCEGRFEEGPSYTFEWVGSVVKSVEPRGRWLPIYG